jgi:hypothetical protein
MVGMNITILPLTLSASLVAGNERATNAAAVQDMFVNGEHTFYAEGDDVTKNAR